MCYIKVILCITCTRYAHPNLIICHANMGGNICIKSNIQIDKHINLPIHIKNSVACINITDIVQIRQTDIICIGCIRLRNHRTIMSVLESDNES